uniref:Putative terminal recognition factor n=1 Tax=Pichia etchellsii TaxID=28550 RepID=Q9HFH1_PICET|nr:putative terminal recognition factor [Schwanniomyces etchellsii]
MVKTKTDKTFQLLKNSILQDLIDKIEKLDINTKEQLIDELKKEEKPKRKAPTIPKEKQCTKICNDGRKCVVAKCYKNSCWAHLNKEDREAYRSKKAEKI